MKDNFLTSFNDLGLSEPILRALTEERYETPTPIQAQTIPHLLAGRDVVGIAQTGTGKTAAFALPILHHLAAHPKRADRKACRVLVLSPTRELSGQIVDSFRTYGRHLRVSVTLAIGGVPIGRQKSAIANGIDVLVATPGRLLDLMQMGSLRLDQVEVFVLDEADRMLDMGFINDIRKIVGKLPAKRQNLFFSATMPREIEDLARHMLRDPARVAVTPEAKTADRIAQRVIHIDRASKPALLVEVLQKETIDRALVFTRTKHGADKVVKQLERAGIASDAIHGNKSQNQRDRVLLAFRKGQIRILIATDIAARGIDVDGISHVFNYDLPNIPESYVHRIGRTARAGAEGIAISFCDGEERAFLRQIEKLIQMSIPATTETRRSGNGAVVHADGEGRSQSREGRPYESPRGNPHRNGNGRSKQGRPQQGRPPQGRPQNGHSGSQNGEARPASVHNGEISGVAFMRNAHNPRRDARPKQARAPR